MKQHCECRNYISLDCDKGQCALGKHLIQHEGEACPHFVQAAFCGNCTNFDAPNDLGIGTCKGLAKESWAFATCSASTCEGYRAE